MICQQEQNVGLYTTFVDLTKAFDTECREGLWTIMAKFGCPPKFISLVKQFYDGMQASVQDRGEHSEPFPVTNGVKQGFVFRTDGKLFNLRRLQAKTKVQDDIARDFLFADDCALNARTQSDMQRSMNSFAKACDDFGLSISTKKTEVMYQPAPATPYTEPSITVNSENLTVADTFIYLCSTLSRNVRIDEEVSY